ncbi:MAG TPA: dihydrofolate reductase [Nannocystaceae bacterium]|nr:dihydrofolate reductase [Nannocystaceae bacterium]
MTRVALIAAVADNGVIGRNGGLPWRIPADLKWFRERTMGHHIVMGRNTWESIGRPLPGRTNVVVSRRLAATSGATVVEGLAAALALATAAGDDEAFVIGGAELYRSALPTADRIYLTRVHAQVDGDTWFPALDPAAWVEVAREPHLDAAPLPFSFCVLERVAPAHVSR